MRSLFLILLLANLLLFASQFDDVRNLFVGNPAPVQAAPINAERLRIVRDTSNRLRAPTPAATATPAEEGTQPINGTNSR